MYRVVREIRTPKCCSSCCTDENHPWTEQEYAPPTEDLAYAQRNENKAWNEDEYTKVRAVRIEEADIDWKVK